MPMRSSGRSLMKAEMIGLTACSRLTVAAPRWKSSAYMLVERSMAIMKS